MQKIATSWMTSSRSIAMTITVAGISLGSVARDVERGAGTWSPRVIKIDAGDG